MVLANTPLSRYYDLIITTPVHIRVGLELKRELLIGELADKKKISIYLFVGSIMWVALLKSGAVGTLILRKTLPDAQALN